MSDWYQKKLEAEVEGEALSLIQRDPDLTLDEAKRRIRIYRRRAYKDTDMDDPDILWMH